jgi:hypothetical protein
LSSRSPYSGRSPYSSRSPYSLRVDASPVSLQAVLARGRGILTTSGPSPRSYVLAACRLDSPRAGWEVVLHPPISLHNSLLCPLEVELVEIREGGHGTGAARTAGGDGGRADGGRATPPKPTRFSIDRGESRQVWAQH